MKSSLLERTTSSILAIAAIVIAAMLVKREFAPTRRGGPLPSDPPEYVREWEELAASGILLGAADAPIKLIEFTDFQCPYCARYVPTLRAVQSRHPGVVARLFLHYPISEIHPHARAAAVAAECAHEQGHFREMYEEIFRWQDSLERADWLKLAQGAGVSDLRTFEHCVSGPTPSRIDKGLQLGNQAGVTGTPTIMLNGWKFVGAPPESVLSRAIESILAGKRPRGSSR